MGWVCRLEGLAAGSPRGAAVVFLEQPVWSAGLSSSAALLPQPWIATTMGFAQQPEPRALFADGGPLRLSDRGHALFGRFVGEGLVQFLGPVTASPPVRGAGSPQPE